MASIELENLTDAEIRKKFIELGSPVGPVTATTRRTLLKKLKSLLEDSGNNSTILNETTSPISHNSRNDDQNNSSSPTRRRSSRPSNKSPSRKSPARLNVTSPQLSVNYPDSSTSAITNGNKRTSRASINQHTSNYSRQSRLDNFDNQKFFSPEVSLSSTLYASPDDVSPRFNSCNDSVRSNFSETNNDADFNTSSNVATSPYCSDFMKRLSASRSTPRVDFRSPVGGITSKLLDVKESDDEDSGPAPVYAKFSHNSTKGTHSTSLKNIRRTSPNEGWFPFDVAISTILQIGFLLFFAAIFIAYMNMHSTDTNLSSPSGSFFKPLMVFFFFFFYENCIHEGDKDTVLRLFHILYKKLYDDMINGPCNGNKEKFMSDDDIVNTIVEQDKKMSVWVVEQHLKNLKVLFDANPKWKISSTKDGITILEAPVTYYCSILNSVYYAFGWIVKIVLACLVLYVTFAIYVWVKKREARHKEEVYRLVSDIIDIVSSKAQTSDNFIPVFHVRDQLIPIKERDRMKKLWDDALKVLESDSRLRIEVQEVEGEQFEGWRWLTNPLANDSKKKVWQGQAFDTMEGSVNSLPHSPTSCLKIRHMCDAYFEDGDDWVTQVVNALLEKCGNAKILHVVVDTQSREGCVYMKCASPVDAGIAYRALHGSWFNRNLVTVKYIREKRYLERFPDSANSTQPLQPTYSK
ncbi:hypothetical protein O3M35_001944 [Rhynocoris fuscipes]|uniref:LEM domain-containing protein n=1 Tax=Rhynocoris fuscipes TaxID=488301 RepID=A0AAW1CTB1_9HEMI